MANVSKQSLSVEGEIDLKEIFKILFESKKLIISTIFIFTFISIIYITTLKPSFSSSTLVEIGYFEMPGGTEELIETPSKLSENLKVDLIYKSMDQDLFNSLIIEPLENKLIRFELTSKSSETNIQLLSSIINYIDERHKQLSRSVNSQKKNLLNNQIDSLKLEIEYIKSKLSDQNQSTYLNLIKDLNQEAQANSRLTMFYENLRASDKLFSLKQREASLLNDLEFISKQNITLSQPIGDIETQTIMPRNKLIISLGFVIGFIFGILLVILKNSINTLREFKT